MSKLSPKQKAALLREHFAALGRKGAAARAEKYTPEQLSEMQRKGALKRWRAYRRKKREQAREKSS